MSQRRKVVVSIKDSKGVAVIHIEGWFHGWGIDFQDYNEAQAVQFTAGIVEDYSGSVHLYYADNIRFID